MAIERGILRSLMYKALDAAYTFNAFYRSAQTKGISYRRADMLRDWGAIRSELQHREALRGLSEGDIPEHTVIGETAFKYIQPYVYKARVTYTIGEGAQPLEQFVTVTFPKPQTIGDVSGEIISKWPVWKTGSQKEIQTIEVLAALYVTPE